MDAKRYHSHKMLKFKPTCKINFNCYGQFESGNYGYTLIEVDAMLYPQSLFNGHQFYIVKYEGAYRLIEYSTGVTIGGSYPDKTANKAAQWFKDRIDQYGTHKIIQSIHDTLEANGRANGIEKQFLIDGQNVSYSNLTEIGALPGEIFDLDTIPCPYTYYLENGLTVKRII